MLGGRGRRRECEEGDTSEAKTRPYRHRPQILQGGETVGRRNALADSSRLPSFRIRRASAPPIT
jgi:hypothetical protein